MNLVKLAMYETDYWHLLRECYGSEDQLMLEEEQRFPYADREAVQIGTEVFLSVAEASYRTGISKATIMQSLGIGKKFQGRGTKTLKL